MPHDTDERLRSGLDANQLGREELCLGILKLDARFSGVRPRQPRGGPDGGRDIDAIFRSGQVAAAAVGFVNGANDSKAQTTQIKKKFASDATSARSTASQPDVFVFMINVALTVGDHDALRVRALKIGFIACEIFDRSLIRSMLDSTDGFALRFQYLGLPLSEAEQTSFFAKWGDGIQNLVTSSFQRVEQTLDRLMFLQEAGEVLSGLNVHFELDRDYPAAEIGHFRAFVRMFLREPKHRIHQLLFGASDCSMRYRADAAQSHPERAGIAHGIGGGQWEQYLDLPKSDAAESPGDMNPRADEDYKTDENAAGKRAWVACGSSSRVGSDPVSVVVASYTHDDPLIRFRPRITLKDLDDSGWIVLMNNSLAEVEGDPRLRKRLQAR